MKSRITIEVDFDNGNEPVIQIIQRDSDDVRDRLIKSFLQSLGGSCWCRIWYADTFTENPIDKFSRIFIKPIPSDKLYEQGTEMLASIKTNSN